MSTEEQDSAKGTPEPGAVQCSQCNREIPADEAIVSEAEDYVRYFCGQDCFDRWHRQGLKDVDVPEDDPRRP
jgi:hypothetical protein